MSIADKLKTVAQKMEDVYRTGLFKYAPKSTASGEMVLLENSAPEPFVNMKPYGHSWQNETPTPTEPQPFESAKEVKVYGKNLLDESTISSKDVSGGFCYHLDKPLFLKGGQTYTVKMYGHSVNPKSFNVYRNDIESENLFAYSFDSDILTFTLYEDTHCVIRMWWDNDNNIPPLESVRAQLELGDYATNYEPYKEQTLTLPTLRGIGDVRDYVDYDRKKLVHRIQKYTCTDVTDVWRYLGDTSNRKENAFFRMQADGIKVNTELLCTHLEGIYTIWQTDKDYLGCECVEANCIDFTIPYSLLGVTYDSTFTEKEDAMRTWLQSNTLEFYGELAEPIETDLTDEQIYAFKRLRANNPTTTIVGQGQVDVTYILDNRQ
jgi:hypothetical protein